MSTPVISRKRARRSTTILVSATTASDDAPDESRTVQNATLLLPTELIYTILAISIGEYIADMILLPSKILKWDAIMTFLHVSRAFRGCTIKLLFHLWGETFIRERTSVIENYKPTLYIFRQLARQARSAPLSFTSQDPPPRLLSARVVRHPITPLARIWSALIRNTAASNALLEDAEPDWTCSDFEEVYTDEDLQVIKNSYAEVPAGIRPLLLGHVMHRVMTQAAFWTKLKELRAAVCSVSRILLQLERMDEIEIHVELPKISEDSVTQTSREMHANYADTFSLAVEDIPPLLRKDIIALGLDTVLSLLKFVERKGGGYADLCQIMRSHIACNLTDSERVQFLK